MDFVPFYLGCLAHASYLVGSDGFAAVVDPQRDIEIYLEEAGKRGLKIAYILETHLHADFVSGHRELAERTGAKIVFGAQARASIPHLAVTDGDTLRVGALVIRVLETPGHTPESVTYLLTDEHDPQAPAKLFTGDTLFIGDVGRPDLAGSKGFTAEHMAELMYASLHEKLLALDDRSEVFPAHGAGSLCGRSMSDERSSTIGIQRVTNPALAPMSKEEFVRMMTSGLPEAPAYFALDAEMNRVGAPPLGEMRKPSVMTADQVAAAARDGVLVLDVRASEDFLPAHVPGSINIGLDGQFASWAGSLIPLDRAMIVVAADTGSVEEAIKRLARVGFSSVEGYLDGGVEAWKTSGRAVGSIRQIGVAALAEEPAEDTVIVDVRRPAEFASGSRRDAMPLPLNELERRLDEFDPRKTHVLVCGSGYRSSIAASILAAHGYQKVVDVEGGMNAYIAGGYPVVTAALA